MIYLLERLLSEIGRNTNVSVDSGDRKGQTPLSRAVQERHGAVVKLLLERDDVNARLEGHLEADAAVAGRGRRARSGHEAAA